MKFPAFEMERMRSVWEHKVKYDLSESGVEPLTLEEAARDVKELLKTKLGYAEGVGLESTRTFVSEFHWKSTAENVVITTGTSEANFLTLLALVNAGDEVVVVMPNYMQVHGVAQGLGARVREVWLREERGWTIDLEALTAAVNAKTKVVCVCTPNNPTGQVLSSREVDEICRVATRHGAWILADEVYRGAEREGSEGASCFFSYRYPIDSMPLVDRLIRDYSTMIVPGVHFKAERHLRIGFGGPSHILHAGLAALDRLLATIGD